MMPQLSCHWPKQNQESKVPAMNPMMDELRNWTTLNNEMMFELYLILAFVLTAHSKKSQHTKEL